MAGGPQPIAQHYEPIFGSFSRHVVYLGGPGSGQIAKLFNNALLMMNQVTIADIVELAIRLRVLIYKMAMEEDRWGAVCLQNAYTSAHDSGQILAFEGQTCSHSKAFTNMVKSLAWSPGGMCIVTTSNSEDVHVWDATNGGNDTILELPSTLSINHVNQVVWSPDGQRIAAPCSGIDSSDNNVGTVLLWDAGSATALTSYTVQSINPGIKSVAWSPDSQRVAAAVGNTVQVLEVSNWLTVFTYPGNSNSVPQVAWSPDGTMIASCDQATGSGEAPTVQVWNANNGSNVSIYRKHQGDIWTVAWSPDSKRVASGGDDWKVHVWNAADASQIYLYSGHSDRVTQVAWSSDSKRIASASSDQTVQVWGAG